MVNPLKHDRRQVQSILPSCCVVKNVFWNTIVPLSGKENAKVKQAVTVVFRQRVIMVVHITCRNDERMPIVSWGNC